MSSSDNDSARDPPRLPEGADPDRRAFVKWVAASGAGLAAGCSTRGTGEKAEESEVPSSGFQTAQPEAADTFEILTTDSPVTDYDDRRVLDRATVRFSKLDQWQEYRLKGEKPEHQFNVRARHRGWYTEVELRLVLHGQLQRHLVLRNRSDLMVKRLWLSRGYYHGDSGRACFAPMAARSHFAEPFREELWFATLVGNAATKPSKDRTGLIAQESTRHYVAGDKPAGRVRLQLHDGFLNDVTWRSQSDGRVDYLSTWFRGTQRYSEVFEATYLIKEARAAGCHALRASGYCDTDGI